jgi:hypothetical protein
MLVIALALLAMFWRLLDPDLTLASNDAPLGSIVHYWPVDNMSGNWNDLNWLGAAAPYGTPSLWMSLEYVTSSPVALVLAIIAWRAFMSVWLWAGGLCFPKFERWRARVLAACATGGCLAVGYALKIGLQTQTLGQAALIVGLPALVVIVLTVFHIKKRIGHA